MVGSLFLNYSVSDGSVEKKVFSPQTINMENCVVDEELYD